MGFINRKTNSTNVDHLPQEIHTFEYNFEIFYVHKIFLNISKTRKEF